MTIVTSMGQNTILTLGHIAVALRHEEKVSWGTGLMDKESPAHTTALIMVPSCQN